MISKKVTILTSKKVTAAQTRAIVSDGISTWEHVAFDFTKQWTADDSAAFVVAGEGVTFAVRLANIETWLDEVVNLGLDHATPPIGHHFAGVLARIGSLQHLYLKGATATPSELRLLAEAQHLQGKARLLIDRHRGLRAGSGYPRAEVLRVFDAMVSLHGARGAAGKTAEALQPVPPSGGGRMINPPKAGEIRRIVKKR